jgi:hypothetical protein
METRGAIAGLLLLLGLGLSCRPLAWPEPPPPTRIEIEVLRGFAALPPRALAAPDVEILVDVSSSTRAAAGAGLRRFEAARLAAARLVRGLPASAAIRLSALGTVAGECEAALPLSASPAEAPRDELLGWIESLEPEGEGSLAAALQALAADGSGQRRVVAFTDLDTACGGDVCAAAAALTTNGARLDLVVVGSAPTPPCLADFAPEAAPAASLAAPAPRFAVWADSPPRGNARARGRADGRPVDLPPGTGVVQLDLEPPMSIGPIFFHRSTVTRIQILDFPQLGVREWYQVVEAVDPLQEAS